ncbi:MAG TPA: flippase activity-associated protein Agl23 [Ktedonobacterales bacterium]|nr:flippase activity-associated protein Agl23 [Ktedonobacterales bacterium]
MQQGPRRNVKARRRPAAASSGRRRPQPKDQPARLERTAAISGGISAAALASSTVDLPPPPVAPREAEPATSGGASNLARMALLRGRDVVASAGQRIRRLSVEQWLWIGVLGLAALLRFWGLGDKPLHHDESMHAYFSLTFAEDPASYAYDPLLHGPFQFHAEGIALAIILALQHLFVPHAVGNPWVNDATARIVPALFGLGIVALPIWLRRELGRSGALIAAFLLAVSPAFVYFSRFLREDIYFNFFMFAMVVCAVRYARQRTLNWFVLLIASTVLAYTVFEGIFLTLVLFGGFLALLAVWELASGLAGRLPEAFSERERIWLSRAGLFTGLGAIAALVAYVGLHKVNELSVAVTTNTAQTDVQVANLENLTVAILLYVSIFIALSVIFALLWQMYRDESALAPRAVHDDDQWADLDEDDEGLATPPAKSVAQQLDDIFSAPGRLATAIRERLDPERQPFLRLLVSIGWVPLFIAFVTGWMLFAALYWIVPGGQVASWSDGFRVGIGRGIWQGLYYWLQQQHVARGGQPWYYYLLLIPLYEQLAVAFGLGGLVYSLVRPNRFRMFLVVWFVGSLVLYSWAAEKMPWLSIHILLPLMLLAAVALERVLAGCRRIVAFLAGGGSFRELMLRPADSEAQPSWLGTALAARVSQPVGAFVQRMRFKPSATVVSAALALLLLIPMVYGMLTLSHKDAAEGPHEMMVYVQTTTDVTKIMNRIAYADTVLYGGQHKIRIGVGRGMEWPWYWYLRDYPNAQFGYPAGEKNAPPVDVLILVPSGDDTGQDAQSFMAAHPSGWSMKEYRLRTWWSEDYKPLPCTPAKNNPNSCSAASYWGFGVGLGNYLSYGSYPKPGARFNPGLAAGRVWNWLWTRQPLGDPHGSTDFVFIVRDGLPISA